MMIAALALMGTGAWGQTVPIARPATPLPLSQSDDPGQDFKLDWRDRDNRWNVSAAARLVEQSRTDAASFQTDGLFQAEAAVVRRYGDFRVGAVGYAARQAGEGVADNRRLGPMRWTGSAVGPVVGYDTRLAGQPATLAVRWYREIDAPGANGDTVAAGVSLKF